MNSGFHKAMATVLDSHLTTVIAGIVITIYGVGTVKGFGYTLTIGIVISLFTAVVVTRWLMDLLIDMNIKHVKLYRMRKTFARLIEKAGGNK
jgi:preprotein translocase subunit SecD